MNGDLESGRFKLVAYRIGESLCLSPSRSIAAVMNVPPNLTQVPGTKPWVLGAAKLNRELIPFINTARFLSVPAKPSAQAQPILVVRGSSEVGSVGLLVDEVLGFIPSGEVTDAEAADLRIPPGLGTSLAGAVEGHGHTWALIDLQQLISDTKLQKIDLN